MFNEIGLAVLAVIIVVLGYAAFKLGVWAFTDND
jgi:hypothetical protein